VNITKRKARPDALVKTIRISSVDEIGRPRLASARIVPP
jgi:hypothetical protein